MRLARQILGHEPPDAGIGRIPQLQAPVAAEDGDAFIEVVQRFALNRYGSVVGAFERQAVGNVLENKGQAAERMRADDEAQRALVGQMQQLFLGLDQRGEHGALLRLEGAETVSYTHLTL